MKLKTDLFIHFKIILNTFRSILKTLSNIHDGPFCENSQQFYAVNFIHKWAPSLMFDCVLNTPVITLKILQTKRSGSY